MMTWTLRSPRRKELGAWQLDMAHGSQSVLSEGATKGSVRKRDQGRACGRGHGAQRVDRSMLGVRTGPEARPGRRLVQGVGASRAGCGRNCASLGAGARSEGDPARAWVVITCYIYIIKHDF